MKTAKNNNMVTFRKGDYIIKQDSDTGDAYMIVTGEAEVFISDKTGRYRHIAYIGPNQTVGEMVLIDDAPHHIYAIATTHTTCHMINRDLLDERLNNSDAFVVSLLKLLTSRYRSLLEDYEDEHGKK
ncbi:MAG: cyclic nucleotide-binding domain-containing protein [Alphaproteobacteria bacterium]|nr:cyclic nucleotide-binding domain-containing protein [Alphaproteobacteria bacterium]